MKILTVNAGSSSIKYKLFHHENGQFSPLIIGLMEGIAETQSHWQHQSESTSLIIRSHQEAMELISLRLSNECLDESIDAVAHRVVHGGDLFKAPTLIDDGVIQQLETLYPLAPLHNPANVQCMQLARAAFTSAKHYAFFDTSFHQTMPKKAYTYAINAEVARMHGIRRYGFHGSNHHYVSRLAAKELDKPLNECQLISLHLGNGASACLIKEGKSFDTSMGMTPLAGLVMGTRCGDIDPSIVLILQHKGFSVEDIDDLLNNNSGLKGMTGVNDMREISNRASQGCQKAQLAIELFCYRVQQAIGAFYSQAASLDALIFTGGIGENAAFIRRKIIDDLAHFNLILDPQKDQQSNNAPCYDISAGQTPIFVIQGDEELYMAQIIVDKLDKLDT